MTRLEALRRVFAEPRDHADMGRIGKRVIHATTDGRERMRNPRVVVNRRWQAAADKILRRFA